MHPLITLRFTTLTKLMEFRAAAHPQVFQMDLDKLIISCECPEENVRLAQEKYGAVVENTKT